MKYFMYFLVAIPWAIALIVTFLLAIACVSEKCYVVGFDLMIFSIIGVIFVSAALWAHFFIMSWFGKWLPFKIKNDGNAKMVHYGWVNLPLILLGGGFAFILCLMGMSEGDPTFTILGIVFFVGTLVIMFKYPNIYIKNEFHGTNQVLKYSAITFKGSISKTIPFLSIREFKTYKTEHKSYNSRIGYTQTVFLLHTLEIIYETEEAEEKNLILVRGRDLDGEETIKQIEAFIADSLAKVSQKLL